MNLLDYIIIVALILFTVKGIFRGFVREISSLAGIILGILVGNSLQPPVSEFLKDYIPFSSYVPLISFAAIFALVLILCNTIGWLIQLLFKKAFLGWVDKLLGACLAITKCTLLTYLVIVMLTFFIPAKTPLIADSLLAPWVIKSYQSIIGLISPDHYKNWKKRILGEQKKISEMVTEKINDLSKKYEQ